MDTQITTTPPTLKDRYQLLNKLIDTALFKWHPDKYKGNDKATAERMTRGLLRTKKQAREAYDLLKEE